jgi:hypothetical protein
MAVTTDDLQRQMEELLSLLQATNDRVRAFELEEQLHTLRIKRRAGILNPLTDIDSLTALDLSKLGSCVEQARAAINDIERRNEAIGTAIMLVRGAIRAAGLGL